MGEQRQSYFRSAALLLLALAALSGCLSQSKAKTEVAIQVDSNNPPVLQGIPQNSVKVGESYAFQPNASDADGDPLSFSIQNKPAWAAFDSNTGRISGTPLLGNEGVYDGVSIVANDGTDSSSLNFSITVTSIGSASVTLSWTPPTENEDGTLLTDLAGYYIYYGDAEGNYPNSIVLDNPGMATYVVGNLSPKTYYFVATSFNSMGVESQYSNVAMKIAE